MLRLPAACFFFVVASACLASACGRVGYRVVDAGASVDAASVDAGAPVDAWREREMRPNAGFRDPVVISSNAGADPQLGPRGLELFVSSDFPTSELRRATRASAADLFAGFTLVDEVNDPEADLDPALSSDGTQLFFVSERGPVRITWFATRADVASPFSMPMPAPGLPNAETGSIDLSEDGNTLYIETGSVLTRATRTGPSADFGPREVIVTPPLTFPTVSRDELLVFGNDGTAGVIWSSRVSTDMPFERAERVDFSSICDPAIQDCDLTNADTQLVCRCGLTVFIATRETP